MMEVAILVLCAVVVGQAFLIQWIVKRSMETLDRSIETTDRAIDLARLMDAELAERQLPAVVPRDRSAV